MHSPKIDLLRLSGWRWLRTANHMGWVLGLRDAAAISVITKARRWRSGHALAFEVALDGNGVYCRRRRTPLPVVREVWQINRRRALNAPTQYSIPGIFQAPLVL
jgi:hypothetical protein